MFVAQKAKSPWKNSGRSRIFLTVIKQHGEISWCTIPPLRNFELWQNCFPKGLLASCLVNLTMALKEGSFKFLQSIVEEFN